MLKKVHVLIGAHQSYVETSILDLLSHEPDAHTIGWCDNTEQTVSLIRIKRPDLVFLEVSPTFNGFEVLGNIQRTHTPIIIMVAADGRQALRAYENQVLDYLVHPLTLSRIHLALQRARAFLNGSITADEHSEGRDIHSLAESRESRRLILKDTSQFHFFKYDEIIWLESSGNYVRLHSAERSAFIRATMKNMAAGLPADTFLRIRNRTVVNLDYVLEVRSLRDSRFLFVLRTGPELTSSRGYYGKLTAFFKRSSWMHP
ncbi:MAG: LytTR family DNA-binding domain-containing protein [Acidobacteriota bacterium]|nr:LytTR family DNA-binding domain-containing protein [Acidobacteriota bacterium]